MSNYIKISKHPVKGFWAEAEWLDDYFGNHHYGVRFRGQTKVYDVSKYDILTEDSELDNTDSAEVSRLVSDRANTSPHSELVQEAQDGDNTQPELDTIDWIIRRFSIQAVTDSVLKGQVSPDLYKFENEAEQALSNLLERTMLDIIGDDEPEYSNLDGDAGYWEKHGRNGFRTELRAKVRRIK